MKKFIFSSLLLLLSQTMFSQIEVKYFNAGWNSANDVNWVEKLSDCDIKNMILEQVQQMQVNLK